MSIALGYAIGKVRIGRVQLVGIPGTLFAAIFIDRTGVEIDKNIQTMAFALFIYSLGYVNGPQFFGGTAHRRWRPYFRAGIRLLTLQALRPLYPQDAPGGNLRCAGRASDLYTGVECGCRRRWQQAPCARVYCSLCHYQRAASYTPGDLLHSINSM